jgi:predicted nucleic acid-binding Zn ribbon protein
MVAVMEQKNTMEEEHHCRFIPLTGDNIYNCELCGVQIAVLQIVTSGTNDQEQFKVCGACLKEYIDQEAATNKGT